MREGQKRLVLVVASSAFTLLLAEGALRLRMAVADSGAGLEQRLDRSRKSALGDAEDRPYSLRGLVEASPRPDVVYELKRGLRGTFQGRNLQTNSHGLRDREYAVPKADDTYRIAGLGDSVMFGWGVHQDEPYFEVLERRLNAEAADGRRFEALNFAVPGYNTAMEVATFEHKALAFDPDLVILHFVDNDLWLPHFMRQPPDVLTFRRSHLLELVTRRFADSGETLSRRSDLGERRRLGARYRHMAGKDGFRTAMARLAALARERAIPVIVLRLSRRHEHHRLVDEVCAEHGCKTLSAGPYFHDHLRELGVKFTDENWGDAFWVSRRDHHPNALGHSLYAAALWDGIAELIE